MKDALLAEFGHLVCLCEGYVINRVVIACSDAHCERHVDEFVYGVDNGLSPWDFERAIHKVVLHVNYDECGYIWLCSEHCGRIRLVWCGHWLVGGWIE